MCSCVFQERTRNAQFIIISLRNNMFELADRLVGIYKTDNCTKSVTVNPNNLVLPLQEVNANSWGTVRSLITVIQGHLFICNSGAPVQINVRESYLLSWKGAPVQKPCFKCPSRCGIKPVWESSKILDAGVVICSCTYWSFRLHLKTNFILNAV